MNEKLALLKSEILDDASRIERLLDRFEKVWKDYRNRKEYSLLVESAFTVNQVYTGYERIFRNIANTFENSISDSEWHRSLLDRMKLEIEGIRPAFLSEQSHKSLHELLSFRHYFRHAYDSDIDDEKFSIVAKRTLDLKKLLKDEVDRFVKFIDDVKE